jgi:hypothetical protein
MAICAKAKKKNPARGYATDFVTACMRDNMRAIKRQGVKVCVNAGGVNALACRDALSAEAQKQGVELKIGVVLGDDLMHRTDAFRQRGVREMYSHAPYPPADAVMSCNAYLGAFPVAEALRQGCDVVITQRVVDSALILGPLIYEFGWTHEEYDLLASGTLAGHLIECGAQCTGGLFTDYERVRSWVNVGYPIVECEPCGAFTVTKPPRTDGLVCVGGVAEQMLYEIQDPGAYHVPDVACDFTQVHIVQCGEDRVRVTQARGQAPTAFYKTCTTHANGWKWAQSGVIIGHDAALKARRTGETLLTRFNALLAEKGYPAFAETRVETIGGGEYFRGDAERSRECMFRIAARHADKRVFGLLRRQVACVGVSMSQGHVGGGGGGLTEVVSSYMHLEPKSSITATVDVDGRVTPVPVPITGGFVRSACETNTNVVAEAALVDACETVAVPLLELCYARSGDKGDKVNIGLVARRPEYLPLLRAQVTAARVQQHFAHFCQGNVLRFDLPGVHAMNFLLDRTLGGGGTSSLHADPLGKSYGQVLLGMRVQAPRHLVRPRLTASL